LRRHYSKRELRPFSNEARKKNFSQTKAASAAAAATSFDTFGFLQNNNSKNLFEARF
jgi:hypothetical protein